VKAAEDYTNSKPNPEIYNLASKALGLDKKQIRVIEDHPHGVKAAKAAGLKCLGVARKHSLTELGKAGADLVVINLTDPKVEQWLNDVNVSA
jgi:beta-phosphoglucomutase-like phosphatase (HAD superfamily)